MTDALPYWFDAALFAAMAFALIQLSTIGRHIMSTQQAIDNVTEQLRKVLGEVSAAKNALVAQIAGLEAQLANAATPQDVDLSGLQSVAQALDDLNVDVPAELPAEAEGEPAEEVVDDGDVEESDDTA